MYQKTNILNALLVLFVLLFYVPSQRLMAMAGRPDHLTTVCLVGSLGIVAMDSISFCFVLL